MKNLHRVELEWFDGSRCELEAYGTSADPSGSFVVHEEGRVIRCTPATGVGSENTRLAFQSDPAGLFEPLRLFENIEYLVSLRIAGSVAGNAPSAKAGRLWPFSNERLASVVRLMPPRYWADLDVDGRPFTAINGTINFGSFVGVADLGFIGKELRTEVASSKIDYFDEFRALLSRVAEDLVELLFEVDSVSGFKFATAEQGEASPATTLFHLRRVMQPDALPAAVESIINAPHTMLTEIDQERPPALAASVEPEALAAIAARLPYVRGGPLGSVFRGYSPTALIETTRRDTFDTPENRYVKAVLEDTVALAQRLEQALLRENKPASAREARVWQDRLEELLAEPLWLDVGPLRQIPSNSQVLLRRDAYREVARTDLLLQSGLVLPWDRGEEIADRIGDIRPVFELYEYFCFFALRRVLRSICGPERKRLEDFYTRRGDSLRVSLRRGKRSRVRYSAEIAKSAVDIDLYFNRSFQRPAGAVEYIDASYSAVFRPDFSIHIQAHNTHHWLLFDAKYRLDAENWLKEVTADTLAGEAHGEEAYEDQEVFKKADLYKMHTYRDAIMGTRGAYILFPGETTEATVFVRHRKPSYRSGFPVPSVGAFALRPRRSLEQESVLHNFLDGVLHAVAAGGGYTEETGLQPTQPA